MIRIPKKKLFDLMFEMSTFIDDIEDTYDLELKTPSFDAISKEIVDAKIVSEYFEYMEQKKIALRLGK